MSELVGIWRVEQEGNAYVVYSGDSRLSAHETLADAETWMRERYWDKLAELKEDERGDQ